MGSNQEKLLESHLANIKQSLLSIKPTGADGFEGLLRLVLTKLTGVPFRLAASGLQGGMDGDSAMPSDSISFEAKRYSGKPGRNEILTKIADFARHNEAADRLWILGATTEINTQLANSIQLDGDKNVISTLILDWTAMPLPFLAVVVIEAQDEAIDFLITHFDKEQCQELVSREKMKEAFSTISKHPEFHSLLLHIKSNVNVSKLALARAINLNLEWREQTFSSKSLARTRIGQALAVLEDRTFPVMRLELQNTVESNLRKGKNIILAGDEGHGKSWLAARLCTEAKGLAIFISAERFDRISTDEIEVFLIECIIKQSGDYANDALKIRWRHRFQAWKTTPPHAPLLVVIDGVNQRQNICWHRLLNTIQAFLSEICGRLIVTVRHQYWKRAVACGLDFIPTIIEVNEWLPDEREMLLQHFGIPLDWLDPNTLRTLQNPRLLSIAVTTIPHENSNAWKGLTTDRLLMEHLRASQLENFENEGFAALTRRLSEHATQVLEHTALSPNGLPVNLRLDANAVIETRFFRQLNGPGNQYELRDEGLTLALGFTLVDRLWQTHGPMERDLTERIAQIVEPIKAMDRTADVIFASLMICALDDIRFDRDIFFSLLDAFANLQNVNDQRFEEFVEIVRHQPNVFFNVLKNLCLESEARINYDWFVQAGFEVATTNKGWQVAEAAIIQWLCYYNKDPVVQTRRKYRISDAKFSEEFKKSHARIGKSLSNLSPYEKKLLEQMIETPEQLDELFTVALKLLAGHSIVSFADSFIKMGLAFALDTDLYNASIAFQQLTTFNRIDRPETRDAFLKAIDPIRTLNSSRASRWTVVRMLRATGYEVDALEASAIEHELLSNRSYFESEISTNWQNMKVANPKALRPENMDEGIQRFNSIETSKILQTMKVGNEDRFFNDFLPIACRFEPQIAQKKTQSILDGLCTRTELPLRQVILNFRRHIPLISLELARRLVERVEESDVIESLPERDRTVCRQLIFCFVAAQLSSEEQLKCIIAKTFGSTFLLSLVPSLKLQPTQCVVTALKEALRKNDDEAAFSILFAALKGNTKINPELEALILHCCNRTSFRLRSVSYELAKCRDLDQVRRAHVSSTWTANLDKESYERLLGSLLLIEAYANKELSFEELLERTNSEIWFAAAHRLGTAFTRRLVYFYLDELRKAVHATAEIALPPVDLLYSKNIFATYPYLLSIEETDRNVGRFPQEKSIFESLRAGDDFDEKQDRLHAAGKTFMENIKNSKAHFFLQMSDIEDIKCLVDSFPPLITKLVELIEQASDAQFVWLKNLALTVANLISADEPKKSVAIFRRANASKGFLILALEDDLTIEHRAIWGSNESNEMNAFWRRRILRSKNDATLAEEVLAAERFGASNFVKKLVIDLHSSENSLDHAYALSISGYSVHSAEYVNMLKSHLKDKGVTSEAAKYALTAHEEFHSARYWVDKMWDAPTSEEFWQFLMIAKTSMDGRISDLPKKASRWTHYTPCFSRLRMKALKKCYEERKRTLLGQNIPDEKFVTATHK